MVGFFLVVQCWFCLVQGLLIADTCFGSYVGTPNSRPPASGDEIPPGPSEGGDVWKGDSPPLGQGEVPRPQGQEGALSRPNYGEKVTQSLLVMNLGRAHRRRVSAT